MQYVCDADSPRDFPTLGVTLNPGDTFDGPDGLELAGLTPAPARKTGGKPSAPTTPGKE